MALSDKILKRKLKKTEKTKLKIVQQKEKEQQIVSGKVFCNLSYPSKLVS
jgi:hypothetical protein